MVIALALLESRVFYPLSTCANITGTKPVGILLQPPLLALILIQQTGNIVSPLISSIVEIGIAILVASGPALKALMRQNNTQALNTSSSSFVELNPERMRRMHDPCYDEECAYPPYPPPPPPPSPANNMPAEFQKEVEHEISAKELMMIVMDADGRIHICR